MYGDRSASLFAIVALAALAPDAASAQSNCDWYAKAALKQQQDNERMKCGLTDASWSFDLKAHMAWCASVPRDDWKSEARKRNQQLAECRKR